MTQIKKAVSARKASVGQAVAENYEVNVQAFHRAVQKGMPSMNWVHATGRLYDKVYTTSNAGDSGKYMVERKTGSIFAIKSWNQHNPRRFYGTVATVDQWDWSQFPAVPKAGTSAELEHQTREAQFSAGYKKRGRPAGVKNKKKSLSSN